MNPEKDDSPFVSEPIRGGTGGPPLQFTFDGHLAFPIYRDEVDCILDPEFPALCPRHRHWKGRVTGLGYENIDHFVNLGNSLIPLLMRKVTNSRVFLKSEFDLFADVASSTTYLQKSAFMRPAIVGGLICYQDVRSEANNFAERMKSAPPLVKTAFAEMRCAEGIKDRLAKTTLRGGELLEMGDFMCDRELCLVAHVGRHILLPTTYLLMVLDKLQARFPLLLFWWLADGVSFYPGCRIYDKGVELIKEFEYLRDLLGQDFFSFVSSWEALVRGAVIASEDMRGCDMLLESTVEDMQEILDSNNVSYDLRKLYPSTGEEVYTIERIMYLELTGISKIFGYPTLVGSQLLDPLREYGTSEQGEPDIEYEAQVVAWTLRHFFRTYFKATKEVPLLRAGHPGLMRMQGKGHYHQMGRASLELWMGARFGKLFEFNQHPDEIELIKDSACSVPFSQWQSQYDSCAFRYYHQKTKPKFSEEVAERRVVLSFLKSDGLVLHRALRERDVGRIPEEDHIATLNGKERELKIGSGRAFTKQTAAQRMVQVALEHNIAEQIFKYVPAQSMTSGDLSNIQSIQAQVAPKEGIIKLTISLDLKKWCLHQRNHNTVGMGMFYDDLFGTDKLYSCSHGFFVGCHVFNGNRLCPPDFGSDGRPIPGPNYLNNFQAGFEGLHQKKWTHFAVGVIGLAMEDLKYDSVNMGQGDNQVIVIEIPEAERDSIPEIRDNFLQALRSGFRRCGHVLKTKETWASINLHEYSKGLIFAGVSVSGGTKKASNIIPDINDGLATYATSLASINTSTEGLARVFPDPALSFFLNQVLVCSYLVRKKLVVATTRRSLLSTLLFPADFGGIPLSTFHGHCIRGIDDKVVTWFSIYDAAKTISPEAQHIMEGIWNLGKMDDYSHPLARSRLLEDVHCLRVTPLDNMSNSIKTQGLAFLRSEAVTHPFVRKLGEVDKTVTKEDFVRLAANMKEYPAGLFSLLFENSNAGLLEGLLNRVSRNKTVEAVTNREGALRNEMIDCEAMWRKNLIGRVSSRKNPSIVRTLLSSPCPTLNAMNVRKLNYGCDILGATQADYSHQVILSDPDVVILGESFNSILIKVSYHAQSSLAAVRHRRGEFPAYVGGSTVEKIKKKQTTDHVVKTSMGKAYSELTKIRSYLERMEAPNLLRLVDLLLAEKLQAMPSLEGVAADLDVNTSSGNMFHRLQSMSETPYAILNSPPLVATHFHQTSNRMRDMTEHGEDWTIFFQKIYVSNVVSLASVLGSAGRLSGMYSATLACSTCTRRLDEYRFDLPQAPQLASVAVPVTQPPVLTPLRPVTSESLELLFALLVANNIDSNMLAHHHTPGRRSAAQDILIRDISGNDLRCLNFGRILKLSADASWYLLRGWVCKGETHGISGNHYALRGVAELVLKTGVLNQLAVGVGLPLSEHIEGTTVEGVARYLFRCVLKLKHNSTLGQRRRDWEVMFQDYDSLIFKKSVSIALCSALSPSFRLDQEQSRALAMGNDALEAALGDELRKIPDWQPTAGPVAAGDILESWKGTTSRRYYVPPGPPIVPALPRTPYPIVTVIQAYSRIFSRSAGLGYESKAVPYVARPLGSISSAASKYVEILSVAGLLSAEFSTICCLAEGSGSVVTTLGLLYPGASLMYNTWLSETIDPRYDATTVYPPASVGKIEPSRFKDLSLSMYGTTNILSPAFLHKFERNVSKVDLLTMDAESTQDTDNYQFVATWAPMLPKMGCSLGIFKVFSMPHRNWQDFLQLAPRGYSVRVVKPLTSNPTSREYFVLVTKLALNDDFVDLENVTKTEFFPFANREDRRLFLCADGVDAYVVAARRMREHLLHGVSPLAILRPKDYLTRPSSDCSAFCIRAIFRLIHDIDSVVNFNPRRPTIPTGLLSLIRTCTLEGALAKLTAELLMLCLLNSEATTASALLEDLCQIDVVNPFPEGWRGDLSSLFLHVDHAPHITHEKVVAGANKFAISERMIRGGCRCVRRNIRGPRVRPMTRSLLAAALANFDNPVVACINSRLCLRQRLV